MAGQWLGPAALMFVLYRLVERRNDLSVEERSVDYLIVPVVNPDGYEYSFTKDRNWHKSRSNNSGSECVGVHPYRNYDINFGGIGGTQNPCDFHYAGTGPMSEPEVRAVSDIILLHDRRIKAFITFGCWKPEINIPYGYAKDAYPKNYDAMKMVAMEMAAEMKDLYGTTYQVKKRSDDYLASGTPEDWVVNNTAVEFSYFIDLAGNSDFDCIVSPNEIRRSGWEAFAAIQVVAKKVAALH